MLCKNSENKDYILKHMWDQYIKYEIGAKKNPYC